MQMISSMPALSQSVDSIEMRYGSRLSNPLLKIDAVCYLPQTFALVLECFLSVFSEMGRMRLAPQNLCFSS